MEVLERVCVKFEKEDEENWVKEGLKTLDRGRKAHHGLWSSLACSLVFFSHFFATPFP